MVSVRHLLQFIPNPGNIGFFEIAAEHDLHERRQRECIKGQAVVFEFLLHRGECLLHASLRDDMRLLPNRLGDLLLVTKHVLACAILVGKDLIMIAADKTFIVPVVLILFDDAHETFNIRFYLRFLFDFKERDDLPLHILNFPKFLFD